MFDFFKDMYLELEGIDREAIEEKEREKSEKKKNEKIIFSRGTKIIVYAVGILYLIMSISIIYLAVRTKTVNAYMVLRYAVIDLIDIACLICLTIKKKKTEIAALVLMIAFMVVQYLTTILV